MAEINLDEQICTQCRGRCCQGYPGVWSNPQRFFAVFNQGQTPTAKELSTILSRERLALRNLGGVLVPAPQNTATGCAARHDRGCQYPIETRPCQCLALVPDIETLLDEQIHCQLPPEYGSNSARHNWRPYQNLLKQVYTNL